MTISELIRTLQALDLSDDEEVGVSDSTGEAVVLLGVHVCEDAGPDEFRVLLLPDN